MKFSDSPYFLLKNFLDNRYDVSYIPFEVEDAATPVVLSWDDVMFHSRIVNSLSYTDNTLNPGIIFDDTSNLILWSDPSSGSEVFTDRTPASMNDGSSSIVDIGSVDTTNYTSNQILSAGTIGGVYFYDRSDVFGREMVIWNLSALPQDSILSGAIIETVSISGNCMLIGNQTGIVASDYRSMTMYIENSVSDDVISDMQRGFVPVNFSYINFNENIIEVNVFNVEEPFGGTLIGTMDGSNLSGGYFDTYDSSEYMQTTITDSRKVYFRKDSFFHDWLNRFAVPYFEEKYGVTLDIRGYLNTDKLFVYLGRIYSAPNNNGGFNYQITYDGLKDYVLNIVPLHQQTTGMKEFLEVFFDRLYHEGYSRQKDYHTFNDPMEIDINYLGYISNYYGMTGFQDIISDDLRYREFVRDTIHLLKRKGTFADLYVIWQIVTQTTNYLNIYERWVDHTNPSISGNTSVPIDEADWKDYLYTTRPEYEWSLPSGGAGVAWYSDHGYLPLDNLSVSAMPFSYDPPEYPIGRYSENDLLMSTNYRVEIDINNEPLSKTSILSKSVMDNLLYAFEVVRPVYRTCRYGIVFSPVTTLNGYYVHLYKNNDMVGRSYDNIYAVTNCTIEPSGFSSGLDLYDYIDSPIYVITNGQNTIVETGTITKFYNDNVFYYIDFELDYASEYDSIVSILIKDNSGSVMFRCETSGIYKPANVDFKIHFRVDRTLPVTTINNDVPETSGAYFNFTDGWEPHQSFGNVVWDGSRWVSV